MFSSFLAVRRLSGWRCALLPDRAVLRVTGPDSPAFLQGLMTNDIELLTSREWTSLYCMFLNTQGRVLFDALVYQGGDKDNVFLLDVDQKCSNLAKKHLSMYKIRRNVTIDLDSQYTVFGAFNRDSEVKCPELSTQSSLVGSTFCNGGLQTPGTAQSWTGEQGEEVKAFPDPRLSALGKRILVENAQSSQISRYLPADTVLCPSEELVQYRCLLGVTEGTAEIAVGKTTPLEYNLGRLQSSLRL